MRSAIWTLSLVVFSFVLSAPSTYAALNEVAVPRYDIASDPLLLIWTFGTEQAKPAVTATGELTADDKKLARWKEKQAHLWAKLETGKRFTINASAYTAAADECGKDDGITASGLKVAEGRTLACPSSYPFGARIAIEGLGEFRCEDRGGAIKGNHIDIYMETKAQAFAFGRQHLEAQIID
ncbi:MAG: 3D domain-containing protein [Candidatus Moraniibacteriota bacterium]